MPFNRCIQTINSDLRGCKQWIAQSVNNSDNGVLTFYPYCYKNGNPTKMTGTNILAGPFELTNPVIVYNAYYEKI